MTKPTTIAKSRTAKLDEIFGKALKVISFSLGSGFRGVETTAEHARSSMEQHGFSKLQAFGVNGDITHYRLHFHSNWWMEIESVG